MRRHEDDRAERYCDIFNLPDADVNVFYLNPDMPSGWHRHQRQTDRFFVVSGLVTFGWFKDGEDPKYFACFPGVYHKIPPNTWHGYEAETDATALLMYLDQKYDPSDEERKSFDEIPWTG